MILYELWSLAHLQLLDLTIDKLLLEFAEISMTMEINPVHF